MLDAIGFCECRGRKKKLKTFRDFPIIISRKNVSPKRKDVDTYKKPEPPKKANPVVSEEHSALTVTQKNTTSKSKSRPSLIRISSAYETVEAEAEIDYGNEPVSQEQLEQFWDKYVTDVRSSSGGFSASVISTCQPTLQDDHVTIHTIFRTETNQIEFIRLSDDFLKYLKSNLKNNHLKFTWEINQEKAKKILFSDREKFEYLVEKYPELRDWENKLGLEFR